VREAAIIFLDCRGCPHVLCPSFHQGLRLQEAAAHSLFRAILDTLLHVAPPPTPFTLMVTHFPFSPPPFKWALS